MKPTLANIKRAVETAGGTVEEDTRGLDVRHLQMLAPRNQRWKLSGLQCEPFTWALRAHLPTAKRFNRIEFNNCLEIVAGGLEAIPQEEQAQYS